MQKKTLEALTDMFRVLVFILLCVTGGLYSEEALIAPHLVVVQQDTLFGFTDSDAEFSDTTRDSLAIFLAEVEEAITQAKLIRNIIYSILILIFAFVLNFIVLKFSHKFEMFLIRVREKQEFYVRILPRLKINLLGILSGFIYFYDGLKLILIIYIIKQSVVFLLGLTDIGYYWDYESPFNGVFNSITLTILAWYTSKLIKLLTHKLYYKFNGMKPKILEKIQYKSFSLISEHKLIEVAKFITKMLYFTALVFLSYFYITILFSFFEFTQGWAEVLFGYIFAPVEHAFTALINFLPNVFAILVIYFLTKYALKVIKYLFTAIEKEVIVIPNFYKDWAEPTYKIVRFLVIVFSVIIIFPYLPGSNSPFFRGISVFVGVLFSLGSSSAIANIVAGVVLTYMRPFKEGDIVKISETTGRIMEKSLLVTRLRTIKNVDITVPNAMVLSSHITNFSSSAQEKGLIVHTTVTQGYEVPWKKVHELLIKAAVSCEFILTEPAPFVLTKSLDDYYITYEINAFTNFPYKMPLIYSELHQNIQELFNDAGLELVSPHYHAVRDGNQIAIPEENIKEGYEKPGFKIDKLTEFLSKFKV